MKAAIQLVEKQGATVVGQSVCSPISTYVCSMWVGKVLFSVRILTEKYNQTFESALLKQRFVNTFQILYMCFVILGVTAVAIENSEGGKWIKDHYKYSHCIPEELQSQIDEQYLDYFKSFQS